LQFLQQYKTYLIGTAAILTATVAFIDGKMSFGEFMAAVTVALSAMGLSAKGNRIEDKLNK
jgi:hypothetical protein